MQYSYFKHIIIRHSSVACVGIGNLNGQGASPIGIKASDIGNAEWDYIFLGTPYPATSNVPKEKLDILRNEFLYEHESCVMGLPTHCSALCLNGVAWL